MFYYTLFFSDIIMRLAFLVETRFVCVLCVLIGLPIIFPKSIRYLICFDILFFLDVVS